MSDSFLSLLNKNCRVLNQNADGVIAFEKAEGVLSHPNKKEDFSRSLFNTEYNEEDECYVFQKKSLYLIHRLDSPTSGILLCANNKNLALSLKEAFESRNVDKCYYAWVKGGVGAKGIWRDFLSKKETPRGIRMHSNKSGNLAETRFESVKKIFFLNHTLSLLKLYPLTGRTHQLRVHCQLNHCPIIGDLTYGDFNFNRTFSKQTNINRLLLHAFSLKISYSVRNRLHEFNVTSPLPSVFDF